MNNVTKPVPSAVPNVDHLVNILQIKLRLPGRKKELDAHQLSNQSLICGIVIKVKPGVAKVLKGNRYFSRSKS